MLQLELIKDQCDYQFSGQSLEYPQGLAQQLAALILDDSNPFGALIGSTTVGASLTSLRQALQLGLAEARSALADYYQVSVQTSIGSFVLDQQTLRSEIDLTVGGVGLSVPLTIGL